MGSLVRAELYKALQHRWTMLFLLAVCVLLPPLVVGNFYWAVRYNPNAGTAKAVGAAVEALCMGMGLGPFLALPVAVMIADDPNKSSVLKNEAVFGIRRWESFLSRLIAGALIGLGLAASVILSFCLTVFILMPARLALPALITENLPTAMLIAVPLWLCSGILALSMLFLLKNSTIAVALYTAFFSFGYLAAILLHVIALNDSSPSAQVISFLCSLHPFNIFWRILFQADETGLSVNFALFYSPGLADILHSWVLALGWSVVPSALTCLVLRHREFR
ncbi:MAG: hypothetical protein HFF18_04890 [Oscillospiraceae bacterium]|nr:hypothetical protein [Oscillospiraceae bacterium]